MTTGSAPAPTNGTAPLSQAEAGIWYAQRVDPDNPIFNTGQYVVFGGPLDVDAFRDAVDAVIADTDVFSFFVVDHEDGPRRIIDPRARPRLRQIDFSGRDDPASEALAWMRRDMATPIDPTCDQLAAEVLFRLAVDRHVWYQRVHHLAIDGYGTALLTRRVCELYRAAVRHAAPVSPGFGRIAHVLEDEATYLSSDRYVRDRGYWHGQFADGPEPAGLAPRAALTAHTYLTAGASLPKGTSDALARLAASSLVVWPDVLVALSAACVERHTGGDEAIVGVASMERLGRPAARVPAMVMNIVPARIRIDEDVPLVSWLATSARQLQQARRHGRYRGEQLRRDLAAAGAGRRLHGPLINVLPFDEVLEWPDLDAGLHLLGTGPVDDLTITWRADGSGAGLRLEVDGNPLLYTAADLEAHARRLASFVSRAIDAPTLAAVATLGPDETAHWVHTVNATAHAVPDTTLTALIEAQMYARPDSPALRFLDTTWTYSDLDRRTRALARLLASRGVGRGTIVGVMAPRSFELVVALIGVLRAGAAYLPIDPGYPRARIAQMIDDSRPALVLVLGAPGDLLPGAVPTLDLATIDPASAPDAPVDVAAPDDAAYVIYTSGSTGVPKGAVIDHRAIVNRLEWMRTHYDFTPADRLLQKTPATFDVSVWEFFLAFTTGAMLVVAPPDAHRDPVWLATIIDQEQITTVHFVPSMLAVFLAEPAAAGLRLARVFCSGEELPAALRDRFHDCIHAELHNLYGPTEAAVDVTCWDASRGDVSSPVPIGFPVWNTQMYVLDGRLRPVPPGVTGDLYIAGIQLARGYLNRPDLTDGRFVPNPFGPDGSRMYRTGDLARWRTDGALLFLGRSDFQVKIRGFRIELGEIEAAIAASGLVAQVAVIAREDRPGDRRLVAYVVPHDDLVDIEALRRHAASTLADYMLPSAFVVLDGLPLSPNGKLRRDALPAPDRPSGDGRAQPPRTATEHELHAMVATVLNVSPAPGSPGAGFGVGDDFFRLGGHSLLAAQLMNRVRARWNIDGGLGMVFAHPTVEGLAARIDALTSAGAHSPHNPADAGLGPVVRITHAGDQSHRPLFCIHPAGGLAWCYGRLARALSPARDVYGLQARGLDPGQPLPVSIDAMAADYVDQMHLVQPAGPYAVAGWSVGGILAHAMGVELQRRGEALSLLAMIDSYPCDRWRNEPPPDEATALRALLLIAGHDPDALGTAALSRENVMAFLRSTAHPLGTLPDHGLTGVIRIVHHNSLLVRQHRHDVFTGDVLYFRAALDHAGTTLSPLEWRPYVRGGIEVHDIDCTHGQLMGPDAANVMATVMNDRFGPDRGERS